MSDVTAAGTPIGPLTGDPAGIGSFVERMRADGADIDGAVSLLRRLRDEGTQIGRFADHLDDTITATIADFRKVGALFDAVRPHIAAYGRRLERKQPRFTALIEEIEEARAALSTQEKLDRFHRPFGDHGPSTLDEQEAAERAAELKAARDRVAAAEEAYDQAWQRWQEDWISAALGIFLDTDGLVREDYSNECDPNSVYLPQPGDGDEDDEPGLFRQYIDRIPVGSDKIATWAGPVPLVGTVAGVIDAAVKTLYLPSDQVDKKDWLWSLVGVIPYARYARKLDDIPDLARAGRHADETSDVVVRGGRRLDRAIDGAKGRSAEALRATETLMELKTSYDAGKEYGSAAKEIRRHVAEQLRASRQREER